MFPSYNGPSLSSPARHLAVELRSIRESAGLSGDAVAKKLGWSTSKVSRLERARTSLGPPEVQKLLTLYKVAPDKAKQLMALAVRAWAERSDEDADRFWAAEVRAWASAAVPLLLRTEDYHRSVLGSLARIMPVSPGMIRDAVNRNTRWQARLLTEQDPLRVRAVLDESVLRRRYGGLAVMQNQVRRLAALAEQEHVDLRVLPSGSGALAYVSSFAYTVFLPGEDGESAPDEVEADMLTGVWQPDSERDVWLHSLAFELLASNAEPAGDYLKKALEEWET